MRRLYTPLGRQSLKTPDEGEGASAARRTLRSPTAACPDVHPSIQHTDPLMAKNPSQSANCARRGAGRDARLLRRSVCRGWLPVIEARLAAPKIRGSRFWVQDLLIDANHLQRSKADASFARWQRP